MPPAPIGRAAPARTVERASPRSVAAIIARGAAILAVALAALLLAARAAAAQAPRLGAGRVAAQVATGTLGGAVGFVAGGLLTRSFVLRRGTDEDSVSRPAFIGALVGTALLTPIGPATLGNHEGGGSYLAAQGGAVAGGFVSALLIEGGRRGVLDCRFCEPLRIVTGVAIALLPSIGATIGYDVTRSR